MAPRVSTTSTDYDHLYRPWVIRGLNGIGRTVARVGIAPTLDKDKLIATARSKTGLKDFGDGDFETPLDVLLDAIKTEARLNTLGQLVQRQRILSLLMNRLRAEDLFKRHPEILETELPSTVAITGFHRTGTTFLHRLVGADPKTRSLKTWEAVNPVPFPKEKRGEGQDRIAQSLRAERGLAFLAPEFFAIHPVETHATEGEITLLDLAFMSQTAEATSHVPSYSEWLEKQDHRPAYEYLAKLFKLLHWHTPAERWVMKTPQHSEHLDALLHAFPHVRVVHTHRDPVKAVGSFASWVIHMRSIFTDHVDPKAAAEHWLNKAKKMAENSTRVRAEQPDDKFMDLHFPNLMKDPMGEVQRIYTFMGWDLDKQAIDSMEAFREKNRRDKYGRHVYKIEDFGITSEQVRHELADYIKRYKIAESPEPKK